MNTKQKSYLYVVNLIRLFCNYCSINKKIHLYFIKTFTFVKIINCYDTLITIYILVRNDTHHRRSWYAISITELT